MKLEIELKGEEFSFNYELGEHIKGHSTMSLSLDSLKMFVDLCAYALSARNKDYEKKFKEIGLKALIETDTELVEKWLNEHKKRKILK